MRPSRGRLSASSLALSLLCSVSLLAAQDRTPGRPAAPPVTKIREGVFRVGNIEVDTVKREASVAASINKDVTRLEFVANQVGGAKAYESALTVMTNAAMFNAALLLLGLDPSHARVPTRHFDPVPPKGDPVELYVAWNEGGTTRRARIEQLLYDNRTKATLAEGPWVYTGSSFIDGRYMASLDGVLIGFVHSPSPIIENPGMGAVDAFGSVVLNPNSGVGSNGLMLVVKAVGAPPKGGK